MLGRFKSNLKARHLQCLALQHIVVCRVWLLNKQWLACTTSLASCVQLLCALQGLIVPLLTDGNSGLAKRGQVHAVQRAHEDGHTVRELSVLHH